MASDVVLIEFTDEECSKYSWAGEREHAQREATFGRFAIDDAHEIARRLGIRQFRPDVAATPGNRLYWIIRGGVTVGSIWLVGSAAAGSAAPVAAIKDLYVSPQWRNQAVEDAVVSQVFDLVRGTGAGVVMTSVFASDPERLAMFERAGFTRRSVTLEADLVGLRRSRFPDWGLRLMSQHEIDSAFPSAVEPADKSDSTLVEEFGLVNGDGCALITVRNGPLGLTAVASRLHTADASARAAVRIASALVQASQIRGFNRLGLTFPGPHADAVMEMRKPRWNIAVHILNVSI